MTAEVIQRAFDPFFTTKPIGHGTGLGLSMIYGFARQSGGQAKIQSEPGVGTTVCIYLPRHHEAAVETESGPAAQLIPGAPQQGSILVVEDEPSIRELVCDVLEDAGFKVLHAGDGSSGLQMLQSDLAFDLLITDVGLPGAMNGRQMADAARTHRPQLKVLFITGYAENAVVGNGNMAPGMYVLTKPFSLDALRQRINDILP
jgi:hypothetical protein